MMASSITTNRLPPGVNSLAIVRPSLQSLMVVHTFLLLLIPLLAALVFPYSCRRPIFILSVSAPTLAFIVGVATDAMNVGAIIPNTRSCRESRD